MSDSTTLTIDDEAYWHDAWAEMGLLGRGFVVWESNRDGHWRLWRRNLDGSGKRRLSPEEEGREHYAPHISPNGRHVVYLSYPGGLDTYRPLPRNRHAHLRLIDLDSGEDRRILDDVRAYFENRAAVWIDPGALIFIDGDGYTRKLSLDSGDTTVLTRNAHREYGWLIDPTLRYATDGRPRFSPYDAENRSIAEQSRRNGCQPYFTSDGKWGFWTSGAGGPINCVHLESGEVGSILLRNDSRMPAARNYLYFPMISPCRQLLAVAASPNQHDHHRSDYAVFVGRLDPNTLQVLDKPVRYSFHNGCDRYPDVFLEPAALGQHQGKAPLTLNFDAQEPGDWRWDFGDGATARGRQVSHTFKEIGSFTVTARLARERLHGSVRIDPPTPPRVRLPVLGDGKSITVRFNEPVALDDLELRLEPGPAIQDWSAGENGSSFSIVLEDDLELAATLRIAGVRDLAQRPNTMPPQDFEVKPRTWPTDTAGLVFLWENGTARNLVFNPDQNVERAFNLRARSRVRLDRNAAMVLGEGAFVAEDVAPILRKRCRESRELTIEATFTPDNLNQRGPARIVTFSRNTSHRNFTLGQEQDQLVIRLRTPQTGDNGINPAVGIGRLTAGTAHHVIVTYRPGHLIAYLNGVRVVDTDAVQGGFDNWAEGHQVLFGEEWDSGRRWAGTLEGVAIFSRFMEEDEALGNYAQYMGRVSSRPEATVMEVAAELTAISDIPTLERIAPYREALAVFEYRVSDRTSDPETLPTGSLFRVMHWVMLDGETLPVSRLRPGERHNLRIETLDINTQIEAYYQSDTLEPDFDMPRFFAVE